MKNILLLIRLIIVFFAIQHKALANHIVGGELKMKPIGAGIYEISLIQFWELKNLIIPTPTIPGNRDPTADLYIYRKKDNALIDSVKVIYRSTSAIEYQNKACATFRSLQTVTGIYTGNVNLSPATYNDPGGYYIIWERCCRNDDINNIVDPGNNGMTFFLEFPPTTITDSSPEFEIPNGQYICVNRDFSMNMSASDVDGDELRYSLVVPMRGNTTPTASTGNDSQKSGYPLVTWVPGVSLSNVIPGIKPLAIDKNGILNVTASNIGLYVFTIQCEEYRNGKKIGVVRRDFQLLVIDCNDDTPEPPIIMMNTQPVKEVSFCPGKSIELQTESASGWSYQWQLNSLNIPGATSSTVMVEDTGSYSVIKSFSEKCSRDTASSLVHLTYEYPVKANISVDKSHICDGETAVLLANGGSLAANLICSWTLDNALLQTSDPKIEVKQPGLYELNIRDEQLGCDGKDSVAISIEKVTVTLPDQISLLEGSSIKLSPNVSPAELAYTYQWSPPTGILGDDTSLEAVVAPAASMDYIFTALSENGCSDIASIKISVIEKMHIPSAFSPNNDGRNDLFEIFNANNQIEAIKIFNRWGEVIYSSVGYDKPWNGTYKNIPVPAGSYPYVIKYFGIEFKGEVLLLR